MMTFEQLASLVERCTRGGTSPFYRNLYGLKANAPAMRINTWDDWLALPFFSKKELMAMTLPARFFPPWKNIDAILASSGTSGNTPVFSPWSLYHGFEYRLRYHNFKKATLSSILTPQQQAWILVTQNPSPSRLVMLDPKHPVASVRLAKAAGVDSIFAFFFHLPPVAEEMLRLGIAKDIRFIDLVGESCSRASFEFIKRTFPNAIVTSSYGSTDVETSPIGIPCRPITGEEPLEVFHTKEDCYLEIVDENGVILPIRKGIEGDLVITTDSGTGGVFPLIRYRIGDTVRIVEEKCAKHGQWSYEVLGRTEMDFIKLPGGVLSADEIERVLQTLGARVESDIFELHQYEREGPQGPLLEFILHVESRKGVDLAVLASDIAKLLRVAPDFTYAQGVAEGRYLPLQCVRLEKNPTPGKRKRVIRH